jgi:hypothetical protein
MKTGTRFLRHDGIYRSDVVVKTPKTRGWAPPPAGRPRAPVQGRYGRNYAPCSSSAMSSGRLFLDRVARQHCPSPLHRQLHPKTVPGWRTMKWQRTANSVLTVCLTKYHAPVEHWPQRRVKFRSEVNGKSSIAIQQCRIGTIELDAFTPNDCQWHLGSILRGGHFAYHLGIPEISGRGFAKRGLHYLSA